MRRYSGITVYFVSKWKLHNAKLGCRRFRGHHTAENIVTLFEEIANNFEITNFSALLDECSNLIDVV